MSAPKPPAVPSKQGEVVDRKSDAADIRAFVQAARAVAASKGSGAGRLIFALDATMSRQPTWDLACSLQAGMFEAVGKVGRLNVQLAYFRGYDECRSSKFVADAASLTALMTGIDCRGGRTQIGKILSHGVKETARQKVDALVFVGDALEEPIDDLAAKAGELGLRGTPLFIFQEGADPVAETGFKELARLSKGAWFRFDRSAASKLAALLSSVAIYAAGGLRALESRGRAEDRLMIEHLSGRGR